MTVWFRSAQRVRDLMATTRDKKGTSKMEMNQFTATCLHPDCDWQIDQPTEAMAWEWASFHSGTMGVDKGKTHTCAVRPINNIEPVTIVGER